MSDFDQLIREKTKEATYTYKASAWRSFAQKAGIKTGAAALYTIVAVAVLSVAAFVVVKMTRHSSPAPETPVESVAVAQADTLIAEEPVAKPVEEPVADPSSASENTHQVTSRNPAPAAVETPQNNAKQETVKPERTRVETPVYGIPVVIDVDTITQMWPTDEELKEGNSRLF